MSTQELLVLNSLNPVKIQDHPRCRCLSVCLLRPADVEAFEASAAHCNPHLLGVQCQADLEGNLKSVQPQCLSKAGFLALCRLLQLWAADAKELVCQQTLLCESTVGLLAHH